ncbi:MAG: DUF192 domain-containing protein [Gemmatimonadota bacterium]
MIERRSPVSDSERVRRTLRLAIPVAAPLLMAASCGGPEGPWVSPLAFDTVGVQVVVDGDAASPSSTPPLLLVELADTDEKHRFGLSRRPSLDSGSGMLFHFDSIQGEESGFWMFRTRIPLDIAFLDSAGIILDIQTMEPCESPNPEWCPLHSPGIPFQGALEVNQGWFRQYGVVAGQRVEVTEPPAPPTGGDG